MISFLMIRLNPKLNFYAENSITSALVQQHVVSDNVTTLHKKFLLNIYIACITVNFSLFLNKQINK
jgi:hypothetical protein